VLIILFCFILIGTQKILTKDKVKVVDDLMVSVLFDILKEVLQFSESKETNDEKNEESHYQKPTNKSALETKQCRIFTSLMQVNYSLELITALSKCSLSFSEHFVVILNHLPHLIQPHISLPIRHIHICCDEKRIKFFVLWLIVVSLRTVEDSKCCIDCFTHSIVFLN
jgi:hypothetical protein